MPYPLFRGVEIIGTRHSEEPLPLSHAATIVTGGRGLGFTRAAPPHGIANAFAWRVQHGFETLIEPLATVLGGAVGATRAVVDAAEIDASRLIGQSGLRVAPRLYIAVGVSGQPQHLQAITRARHVVAINPDPTAPIFEVADIAIIAEAERVIPDLITLIDAHRAKS
ncbi:MAG: FAD-binding protein [Chloroflexota bacterium]